MTAPQIPSLVLLSVGPFIGSTLGAQAAITLVVDGRGRPSGADGDEPVHVAGTLIVANTAEEQQPWTFGRSFATSVRVSLIAPAVMSVTAIAVM